MFTLNGMRFDVYGEHVIDGEKFGAGAFLDAAVRDRVGVVMVEEPAPPEGYSEKLYDRIVQDDAPYVTYELKPQSVLDAKAAEACAAKKKLLRDLREIVLNRLTGIKDAARDESDTATVEACKSVRIALLGITSDWPTNPDLIDGLVLNRWRDIVNQAAVTSSTVLSAFNQVDL